MSGDRKQPVVTYLLLVLNVGAYAYLSWKSNNLFEIEREFMLIYGFNRESFFSGAFWQAVTNMLVHFDFTHLGYNMVFLAFFGSRSEEIFGSVRTLFFYLGLGLLTTTAALIYPLGTVSAGASGAIFGLLGSVLIAQRGIYPNGIWTSFLYGLVFFAFAAATGFLAHLLGLVFGFIFGYLASRDWYPPIEAEDEEKQIGQETYN